MTQADANHPTGRQPTPTVAGGRFPNKGRQNAYDSFTSTSLCTRQSPEQFGGVSTD